MAKSNAAVMYILQPIISILMWSLTTVGGAPADDVSYADIQALGKNCSSFDSCNLPRERDSLEYANCHCGKFCAEFDTCCVDSPFRPSSSPDAGNRMRCIGMYDNVRRVYMIDSCDPNWTGDESIEQLCLSSGEDSSDPTLLIPVTNAETGITYKNYFCSICNGQSEDQPLVFWTAEVSSSLREIPDSPLEWLLFDKFKKRWTIQDPQIPESTVSPENGTGSDAFADRIFDVTLVIEYPEEIQMLIRSCRSVISECDPRWEDDDIRRKCSAYMAITTVAKIETFPVYRNAHCALCNFESLDNANCYLPDVSSVWKPVLPFSLLLDVNTSSGKTVGKKEKCGEGAIYDPHFKKCRALKCALPGYSIQKGKCAKD